MGSLLVCGTATTTQFLPETLSKTMAKRNVGNNARRYGSLEGKVSSFTKLKGTLSNRLKGNVNLLQEAIAEPEDCSLRYSKADP